MDYAALGGTGLLVSVMGLGCGGHSRLGLAYGRTADEAASIVRRALDLGVNFFDTAESYGTEAAVGKGIVGVPRESVVISTKAGVDWQGRRSTGDELFGRLEAALERMRTDYVDIYHLHGVTPDEYAYALQELAPAMLRMRDQGKIRFVGITEAFLSETSHQMLAPAVETGPWQVVMVGFSLLNPSARHTVLPTTIARGIGTLDMFAVRRALSQPVALRELVAGLVAEGSVDAGDVDPADPLGWLVAEGHADGIPEAAYRFCRHEPGIDVVLSGTGSIEHLEQNARSICGPALSDKAQARLRRMFGRVDSVSGN